MTDYRPKDFIPLFAFGVISGNKFLKKILTNQKDREELLARVSHYLSSKCFKVKVDNLIKESQTAKEFYTGLENIALEVFSDTLKHIK